MVGEFQKNIDELVLQGRLQPCKRLFYTSKAYRTRINNADSVLEASMEDRAD